jgi:hypothetical protein
VLLAQLLLLPLLLRLRLLVVAAVVSLQLA